ncbi:MAG TPA: hypothetical protein VEW47_09350 [Candidatus Dormibacteraeota bacterium]|nr:hypothetical protein [Candidatus Dormibacteraeota bacterium]
MNRKRLNPTVSAFVAVLFALASGCSSQKNDNLDTAEQAPPPPATSNDSEMAGTTAPEPPPPPPAERNSTAPAHPKRTRTSQSTGSIPEERPHAVEPKQPAPVVVTIPAGTSLSVNLPEALSSETALVGDRIRATLKSPLIVGDRVVFPAGSTVEGDVSDVKSAKKGFKETGGALSLKFNRIIAPDGHSAAISAGFTKVATGSAGKKAGIIGGSAVGGALLGKVLGKDAKGGALIGGAIGTAVAGSTKGKEAVIQPEEDIQVGLERSAQTTLRP